MKKASRSQIDNALGVLYRDTMMQIAAQDWAKSHPGEQTQITCAVALKISTDHA